MALFDFLKAQTSSVQSALKWKGTQKRYKHFRPRVDALLLDEAFESILWS